MLISISLKPSNSIARFCKTFGNNCGRLKFLVKFKIKVFISSTLEFSILKIAVKGFRSYGILRFEEIIIIVALKLSSSKIL